MSDCFTCRYAYVTKDGITEIITKKGDRHIQIGNGTTCMLSFMPGGLKANITINGGDLICSAYTPGNGITAEEYKKMKGETP